MDDLMRRDRLSETEAASAIAIARGLGLRLDYVVRVKRDLSTQMWNLAPVFYISERGNMDPRQIWQMHRRGAGWMEIDSGRGRNYGGRNEDYGYQGRDRGNRNDDDYGYGRDPYGQDPSGRDPYDRDPYGRDRYDNNGRRGGLADLVDDILGRRDDDSFYRNNRDRYGRQSDKQYEQRVWDQILRRAYNQNTSRLWRYVDRGAHIGDIALAVHVARIARVQPERVMDELMRTHNWNRVRETFGIARDWESRDRNYNGRDRGRNRDLIDDLIDIIR
jgi:hypothetical protein